MALGVGLFTRQVLTVYIYTITCTLQLCMRDIYHARSSLGGRVLGCDTHPPYIVRLTKFDLELGRKEVIKN